jgi:hypothetical protein
MLLTLLNSIVCEGMRVFGDELTQSSWNVLCYGWSSPLFDTGFR